MKKSTIGIFVGIGISILAITFIPGLVKYLVPPVDAPSAEPVYHRVEAERYEVVFPINVNGNGGTFGALNCGTFSMEDFGCAGGTFVIEDDDLIDGIYDLPHFEFYVYLDSVSTTISTDNHVVLQGEYGRYVISETQVADEPVAYTLEPIYEYVLV